MKVRPLLLFVPGIFLASWIFGSDSSKSPNPWIKITKSRIPMDFNLNVMCAPMMPSPMPHPYASAEVYSNSTAIEYRKQNPQKFDYPTGSMFLKTKYSNQHQRVPDDLGTLMIKKANKGKVTDWEFSIMNVKTGERQMPTNENLRNCINCHEGFSGRGFLSRESELAQLSQKVLKFNFFDAFGGWQLY